MKKGFTFVEILAVIVVYYDEDEPDVNLRWKKADRNNSNNSHEQTMENGDKQSGYYYDDSQGLAGAFRFGSGSGGPQHAVGGFRPVIVVIPGQ